TGLGIRHPPATPVGSPTDGAPVGPPGTSSPPLGETVAQSSARHPTAVTGLRGGAVTAGRLGGAGGDPVAAGLEGQCALLTPASARNPAPGKLFRAFSRACAGGLFALKPGSWTVRCKLSAAWGVSKCRSSAQGSSSAT